MSYTHLLSAPYAILHNAIAKYCVVVTSFLLSFQFCVAVSADFRAMLCRFGTISGFAQPFRPFFGMCYIEHVLRYTHTNGLAKPPGNANHPVSPENVGTRQFLRRQPSAPLQQNLCSDPHLLGGAALGGVCGAITNKTCADSPNGNAVIAWPENTQTGIRNKKCVHVVSDDVCALSSGHDRLTRQFLLKEYIMFLDCRCRDCEKLLTMQNMRVDGNWVVCKDCAGTYHLPSNEQDLAGSISELGTQPGDRCWIGF